MQTRIIYPKFWQDNYICQLKNDEKLLFLYLLTNEKVNIIGIYELPDKYILADIEITNNRLQEIKGKFSKDSKFKFYDGWVKIVNFEKYNNYSGEKNNNAKKLLLAKISDTVLKNLDTVSIGYRYSIDTLINHKSEIRNQKPRENEGEKIDYEKEFKEKILVAWKYLRPKTRASAVKDLIKNYAYWREVYDPEFIIRCLVTAVNIPVDFFNNIDLTVFFRRKDRNGDAVDRFSSLDQEYLKADYIKDKIDKQLKEILLFIDNSHETSL